ncbi:uncharacterized protein si:ch211-66k16.27 [Pseudorasbora parva]|uniref:uncharacterized protein si:ch211-66k16.27 n=1 Tax=Pseudorasbora parva TaxID=51549 RepID=UPI00351E2023
MSENNIEGDQPERCKEAKFVDDNSAELIQRVTSVLPIADELKQEEGMLHQEKYDEIKAEKTNQDKMRKLFESLNSGGNKVKIAFYYLLEKHHSHLFKDLGGVSRKRKLSDPESTVPYKRLNNESYEPNNPHASTSAPSPAAINFVTNIVNERRPYENINNISILKKMEWKHPAPMKEKKPPAPKKDKKPLAPKKENKPLAPKKDKKPPVPKKDKKPPSPKKEKKPPAPKKEKKPPSPKKEKKPPVPKKEKKPPAPKKEKKPPVPKKEKKPPAPKKVKKTPAPKKEKKPPAPKKVKKTTAPKKVKKTTAPKKVKKTPAPKKVKKTPAPKKVKKAAA